MSKNVKFCRSITTSTGPKDDMSSIRLTEKHWQLIIRK